MDFFTTLSALLILCSFWVWYRYMVNPFDYWKKQGVPSVPGVPIVGSMLPLFWLSRHEFQLQCYKKYGRIFGLYESTKPVLYVADPDLIRMISLKDFHNFVDKRRIDNAETFSPKTLSHLRGEDWKRVRSILTPAFTSGRLKRMFDIMSDSAESLVSNLSEIARKKQVVDIKEYFGTFALDVIASCVFATKLDSINDPENIFVKTAKEFVGTDFPWRLVILFVFPGFQNFFKVSPWKPEGVNFFRDIVLRIMEERRKTGQKGNDFLQLIMDIAEETESAATEENGKADEGDFKQRVPAEGKVLTMDELIANCLVFLLAGYFTMASTLSTLAYCLALNPDVQEKLAAEVDETIRKYNGEITYDMLRDLKYMDMVISENLRMYTSAVAFERQSADNYKLGDTGITVPKGMIITVPIYGIHYDPEFYPDPYRFDPERFSPEEKAKRNPYVYVPFGSGPRNCIGMRFALMEIKIALIHVLRKFRFKRCPQTKVPLQYRIAHKFATPTDIILSVEEREKM